MKANFLKIAKVKSEKDFYKKYPTEEAFFKAHPEARKMQHGGAATANQFFDYGMQAAGPLAAPETWYQDGGQYGGQTQLGGEPEEVDYSFINDFANMLYPDTEEKLTESEDEVSTEDETTEEEPTEDTGESFQIGGSKSAFNYGQFPALKSGGIQGGNINAAGSNIKENFLAGIRKYVADNELEQLNNEPSMDEASMGQYAQYGAQSGYGANYNPNLYNQEAWQGAINARQGKVQAGFNQLQDVMGQNVDYVNQQNEAKQKAKQEQAYNNALKKYVSGEMAKSVATPTGDVVSQPADAGQQTIDLAPNTNNIWGMQPSFKNGGSKNYLPKAQTGAQAGLDYTSPNLSMENFDINKLIENSKKAAQNLTQKRKDDEDIKNIQYFKEKRDAALKELSDNPEGYTISSGAPVPGGLGNSVKATPEQMAKNLKHWDDLYKTVYNSYYKSRNIASPSESYTSQEDYYKHLLDPASPAKTAAQKTWIQSPGYKPVTKKPMTNAPVAAPVTQTSTGTSQSQSSNQAPDQTMIVPTSKGSASFDPNYKKPAVDTAGLWQFMNKKSGGSVKKYDGGGTVTKDNGKFRMFSDGSVLDIASGTYVVHATTPATTTTPVAKSSGTGVTTTDNTKTATTTSTVDLDAIAKQWGITKEELIRRLNPKQGAGYYGDDQQVPYRYRHRGYGTIGADRGYVPNETDLLAMQAQANKLGYDFTARSRPTIFGGRRVVVKTRYNPKTGQVEQYPSSTPDTQEEETGFNPLQKIKNKIKDIRYNRSGDAMSDADAAKYDAENADHWKDRYDSNQVTGQTYRNKTMPTASDVETPEAMAKRKAWEKANGFAYGGALDRFIPTHQTGAQTGMYDWGQAEGYNIPQSATVDGTPNTMGKKGNEKNVWRTKGRGMNPYTADYLLAAGNIAEGMLGAADTRAYENKLKKMRTADYTQVASGKDMGDYGPTGQQYGAFRMNQTTPTFDVGYIPGMAGQAPIAKAGGSMSPYSYPSTLPVLPHTGMPAGDMSMYTHWNQRPVMAYGGDSNGPLGYFNKGGMPCMDCGGYMQDGGEYEQDGVYDLSQDEINQIMANGGQIEFID